jgi:hypothetical protein
MNETHRVSWMKTLEYEEGWGVAWTSIWNHETQSLSGVEGEVIALFPENVQVVGEVPCMRSANDVNMYHPIENFRHLDDLDVGDTHDFRDRWFATKEAAEEHYKHTMERFKNPQPWEAFVTFD